MEATLTSEYPIVYLDLSKEENSSAFDIHHDKFIVDRNSTCMYFITIGIHFSCRFYTKETCLSLRSSNKYEGDFQYDYREPRKEHSLDLVDSGTYGEILIASTLQEMIKLVETKLKEPFRFKKWPMSNRSKEIKSKYSIKEIAKLQAFHHNAMFSRLNENFVKSLKFYSSEYEMEFRALIQKYKNRNDAIVKYETKLNNVFEKTFKVPIQTYLSHFKFKFHKFKNTFPLDSLTDREQRVLIKIANHYSH